MLVINRELWGRGSLVHCSVARQEETVKELLASSPRPWVLLLTKVLVSHGGNEEGRVLGPLLDAGDVEERVAPATTPHLWTQEKHTDYFGRDQSMCVRVLSVCVCLCVCMRACLVPPGSS